MREVLKPCPFCGSKSLTLTVNEHHWKIVECDDCGMRGPCIDLEDEEYLARWNTRAALSSPAPDRLSEEERAAIRGLAQMGQDFRSKIVELKNRDQTVVETYVLNLLKAIERPVSDVLAIIDRLSRQPKEGNECACGKFGDGEICPAPEAERDIRWAINYLLEQIAKKFEAHETFDLWRWDAASIVRSFKHDLSRQPEAEPVAWIEFADNGNIRFWTSDPARAWTEGDNGRPLRKFTLAELVALAASPRLDRERLAQAIDDGIHKCSIGLPEFNILDAIADARKESSLRAANEIVADLSRKIADAIMREMR